jgi:CPA1 family monovalent cation:H+ antiporter
VEYLWVAAAVCAAVIVARIVWVSGVAAFSRWRCRPVPGRPPTAIDAVALSPRAAALVGWCGMRGIVTLAAALALPTGLDGVMPFPFRDLILFTAFAVVLGTLVVQGMTLRPLLTRLGLEDDDTVEREVRRARVETLGAAMAATNGVPGGETAGLVKRRYEVLLRRAEAELDAEADRSQTGTAAERSRVGDFDVVRVAMAAERQQLSELRADGTIGDAAFQQIEEELDWAELDARF